MVALKPPVMCDNVEKCCPLKKCLHVVHTYVSDAIVEIKDYLISVEILIPL